MNDVCFVKTPNTVTVGCGLIGRTFQVILRLYESKADVLNGFDIDCCCVGYDGTQALITPRCITALRTRINTVNLEIRGESYECRLLKYVERGFAIGIPLLDASRIDREHLTLKMKKHEWYDGESLTGGDWAKWGESEGLERLLMAISIARQSGGVIERAFPGRQRGGKGRERTLQMKLVPYPRGPGGFGAIRDSYPSHDKAGNPIWPATTKLEAIRRSEKPFEVAWLEGNMPRKPLTWDAWSKKAYLGAERRASYGYDPAQYRKEREEREAREKAKRAEEIESARREAAAEAAAEAADARAQIEVIEKQAAESQAELKRAKKETEAKARQASAAGPPRRRLQRRSSPWRARIRRGSRRRPRRRRGAWRLSSCAPGGRRRSSRWPLMSSSAASAWTGPRWSCLSRAVTSRSASSARLASPSARSAKRTPRERWSCTSKCGASAFALPGCDLAA